jgi:hypothetical protein
MVDPAAAVQGVRFTQEEAEAVADFLNQRQRLELTPKIVKRWEVDWYVCRADHEDVAFEKKQAREEKRRPKFTETGAELWRSARSIGPIAIDHSHWGGYQLSLNQAQVDWVTRACLRYEAAGNPFPEDAS